MHLALEQTNLAETKAHFMGAYEEEKQIHVRKSVWMVLVCKGSVPCILLSGSRCPFAEILVP